MYLPPDLPKARVLITVKTYPLPSGKYGELVCTAGLLDGEKWVRVYPIPFDFLSHGRKYPKYSWIQLDLVRNHNDFRPESYRPHQGIDEDIQVVGKLDTAHRWAARREHVLKEVFTSMDALIGLAKGEDKRSLATFKPLRIVDFIVEDEGSQWKQKWLAQAKQGNFFELNARKRSKERPLIQKLPYKYHYKFICEGSDKPSKMKIEDWEIGALFWNSLRQTGGDEAAANRAVRHKYYDEFVDRKDLYLFLGTTKKYHNRSRNPFVIVGIFYPPKNPQMSLF